jgi:hypothetical protein
MSVRTFKDRLHSMLAAGTEKLSYRSAIRTTLRFTKALMLKIVVHVSLIKITQSSSVI